MGPFEGKNIVLGVGGGIAVYRVCELARLLMKRGAAVRTAMTKNAQEFVTPLTFQSLTGHPVLTDLFDLHQKALFGHLELGRRADLFIAAPATANLIARIRMGMGDDAVTTTILSSGCPVLIAPAMNVQMWRNRQVQENVEALKADGRFHFVGPGVGTLACGTQGEGRLSEPEEIVDAAQKLLTPQDMAGLKVVVTAGPTREMADPVRFLSNPSTGKMGFALARMAAMRGAKVTLVSGPVTLPTPPGVTRVDAVSAFQMREAVMEAIRGADMFISAAAVCDQTPARVSPCKVKKESLASSLELVRTPDILKEVRASFGDLEVPARPLFVGFAAETEDAAENARKKLMGKRLDMVAANDVTETGSGFGTQTNRLTLVTAAAALPLPFLSKEDAADELLTAALKLLETSRRADGKGA